MWLHGAPEDRERVETTSRRGGDQERGLGERETDRQTDRQTDRKREYAFAKGMYEVCFWGKKNKQLNHHQGEWLECLL